MKEAALKNKKNNYQTDALGPDTHKPIFFFKEETKAQDGQAIKSRSYIDRV